jgi:flavin reductase (DIM6/NTAB) family NADH-FMN oxidoreductase RutF
MNTSSQISSNIEQPFDAKDFRRALGQFGTGVAIVTALDQAGKPIGMTINSFASVSLDPPLILWSVQLDTPSWRGFSTAKAFAVTVLHAKQEALALKFARTGEDKFEGVETITGLYGVPLFPEGVARFECETEARHLAGDHEIIIGRVKAFQHQTGPALGFRQGRFFTFDA